MSDPGYWFEAEPLVQDGGLLRTHIRGFFDGNGDGSGDFRGLTEKLDYLQWLGVDCIWLLPFYKSPLRDGGDDISDYFPIHPDYGVVEDVPATSSSRPTSAGIRVIADLRPDRHVVRAPVVPGGALQPRQPEARLVRVVRHGPPVRGRPDHLPRHARHRTGPGTSRPSAVLPAPFFSHQPDLNFDNPELQDAMLEVLRFWLDIGLDGCRLDAVPYLFEREGTICENLSRDACDLKRRPRGDRRATTPTACCSPRPTSGPPTWSTTTATATSARCASTSP